MNKVVTISEAAEYLGVFSLTLRNWEKKGLIKSFRTPGGHRRYLKSELDRILEGKSDPDTSGWLGQCINNLQRLHLGDDRQKKVERIIEDLKKISESTLEGK